MGRRARWWWGGLLVLLALMACSDDAPRESMAGEQRLMQQLRERNHAEHERRELLEQAGVERR